MRARVLFPLAALALAGCPPPLAQHCNTTAECPAGYTCDPRTHVCAALLVDGGPADTWTLDRVGSDGGPGDAATRDGSPEDALPADSAGADRAGIDASAEDGATADQGAADSTSADVGAGTEAGAMDTLATDAVGSAEAGAVDAQAVDAGANAVCGTVSALVDSFSGSQLSWLWWDNPDPDTLCELAMGGLRCTLATAAHGGYADVWADPRLSLRGDSVRVEAEVALATSSDHEAYLEFNAGSGRYLAISTYDGRLEGHLQDGSSVTRQHMAFDANLKHWRLGEAGGRVFAGASTDGVTWQDFFDAPAPGWIDRGSIGLGLGSWGPSMLASAVLFKNLNLGSTTPFCPPSTLHDTLRAGSLSGEWYDEQRPGCSLGFDSGGLTLQRQAGINEGSCTLSSTRLFDIANCAVELSVPLVPAAASNGWAGLAFHGENYWVELALGADGVYGWSDINREYRDQTGPLDGSRLRLSRDAEGFGFALLGDTDPVWSDRIDVAQSLSPLAYVVLFVYVDANSTVPATCRLADVN